MGDCLVFCGHAVPRCTNREEVSGSCHRALLALGCCNRPSFYPQLTNSDEGSRGETKPLLLATSFVSFFSSLVRITQFEDAHRWSSNSNRTARNRIYRSMNLPNHATLRMEQELSGASCMYWGSATMRYSACRAAKFGRSQLKSIAETGPIFACVYQRERGVQYVPSGNFAKCARKTWVSCSPKSDGDS